jgi:DNA-binding beta-propeller fold protein YncE
MPSRTRTWTALSCLLATAALAGESGYHADRSILVGGDGGWDYIVADTNSHRLYVSHSTHVVVVDTRTDSLAGDISDTPGVHGVALAYDVGRGFTSNGRDSSVSVFDMRTLAVTGRIHVGSRNPDAILYDKASGRVFTFNGGGKNTTAIDVRSLKVVGALALGGKPEAGVADGKGRIYVNNEDSSTVVEFDSRKLKQLHVWSLAPGKGPSGLAFDRAHHRLFSGCSNQTLIVLDSQSGRKVAELPIGKRVDGVEFDPARQLVFSSNGEGTLTVIHEDDADHYRVLENVPTQLGGRTLALDPRDGAVYIPTADLTPPPAPTPENPDPRWTIVPGTFRVLVVHHP